MLSQFSRKVRKKDTCNYRPVSLIIVPGKIMEIFLGVNEKHLTDNAVIGHSQHGFMRGKSCLINSVSFSSKVTHLLDQGKTVHAFILDFSYLDFVTLSHSTLLIRWVNR